MPMCQVTTSHVMAGILAVQKKPGHRSRKITAPMIIECAVEVARRRDHVNVPDIQSAGIRIAVSLRMHERGCMVHLRN